MKRVLIVFGLAFSACSANSVPRTTASLEAVPHLLRADSAVGAKGPLLFVSDSTSAMVYMYQLSTLKVINTVSGLTDPQGECSDTKGDVWVTDVGADSVYELSHEGRLENTLSAAAYPVGCAWDPASGNLAVMSLFGGSGSGSHGGVTIYRKRGGSPHEYQNPTQYYYNFGGYDTNGNLFFDGRSESGAFILSELPKGVKQALTIAIEGGTIYYPGMVQWDSTNKELIVGDQSCGGVYTSSCLYAIQIASNAGTIVNTISLQNAKGAPL